MKTSRGADRCQWRKCRCEREPSVLGEVRETHQSTAVALGAMRGSFVSFLFCSAPWPRAEPPSLAHAVFGAARFRVAPFQAPAMRWHCGIARRKLLCSAFDRGPHPGADAEKDRI